MSEIKTIGIAGAGTMGAGIAIVCARAGFRTRVFDLKQDALDRARKPDRGLPAQERGARQAGRREAARDHGRGAARPSWKTSPTATW
jgi:3-hydroxybutyryl-CoA dehydrogenase